LHPRRLSKRVPSAKFITFITVPGWSLKFHKRSSDGSGKCNIVGAEQSVFFALFDIDASDKPTLDRVEGLNYGYEEIAIETENFGRCFCYIASSTHIDENLQPYSWYKELVIVGLEYHQASPEYLERVQSIEHIIDSDKARHYENMAIVSEAQMSGSGDR
jgi:hypothetical protein